MPQLILQRGIPHRNFYVYFLNGGVKNAFRRFRRGYPPIYNESPIMNSEGRRRLWMGFFPPADS